MAKDYLIGTKTPQRQIFIFHPFIPLPPSNHSQKCLQIRSFQTRRGSTSLGRLAILCNPSWRTPRCRELDGPAFGWQTLQASVCSHQNLLLTLSACY